MQKGAARAKVMTSHFPTNYITLLFRLAAKETTKLCGGCAVVWTQIPIVCPIRYV